MTVAEAQSRISSREFAEWMAYDLVDPFGQVRGDLQAGVVASQVFNVHQSRGRAAGPSDYLLKFTKRFEAPPSEETLRSRWSVIERIWNRRKRK